MEKRKPFEGDGADSGRPTAPPPRPEMPTLPFDLSEYARDAMAQGRDDKDPRDEPDFGPTRVPRIAVSQEVLLKTQLSHKAGFLVSLLDGISTVEMVVDVAGMPEEEALAELQSLYLLGIIQFE